MTVHSAGILLYRRSARADNPGVQVLLAHPGGPFFAQKDDGFWSIPKGEFDPGSESALDAARREFAEETGTTPPAGPFSELGNVEQRKGKIVHAFGALGDLDPETVMSNEFALEWPPHSGLTQQFPEIDRVAWFNLTEARRKILSGQLELLDRLEASLGDKTPSARAGD